MSTVTPRLIVPRSAEAIAFYADVFGAIEKERHATPEGHIVHAAIVIGDSLVTLADEAPEWQNRSPKSLGGTPVILSVVLEDPDAVCANAVAKGAKVIFPVADREYGRREGRIQDPFGHFWILSKLERRKGA